MSKNVFIAGKAGAGKTYLSQYLINNYKYVPSKFAYPVYDIARNYFNMQGKDRFLLQLIGTDVGRKIIDTNIWVNRFLEDMKIVEDTARHLGREINFVSDDVRFPNECDALLSAGWIGVFLNCPDEVRITRLGNRDGDAQVATLNHVSETAIELFKDKLIQIDASGSVENSNTQLEEILKSVF